MRDRSSGWPARAKLLAFVAGLTTITSFAWAATHDDPQNIKIGGAGYNASTQKFEIQFSAKFGIATAGEKAGFVLSSTVRVIDAASNEVASVTGAAPVERASGSAGSDPVPLVPQLIFWDRNGGAVSGTVTLKISTDLQKNGQSVANASDTHTESGVDLGGGRTDSDDEIVPAEPAPTPAGMFLSWSVILLMSVFIVIHRWLRTPS